ncbi:DNA polymerase III epsilon subunit family exonuclease [Breznakia sp. PF5-3]|uniref:3'-5' exonuclease n=1 Tax=unclassified Breznakia TaxID=2623764 RepID=UPI00240655B0|nr:MULTISPECIES: 3'-5' exonuclease [unclassified Breznakia]MDF9824999.1 DNA polymerase III epsilon subunit family exonuclease [Breznakia sp. PM6-1]MDF9835430.1 DNA polymerase III epsilon subunit family exonuclease [Breznakia sp. PF5-3]MDF9837662.1 DNA polymerase III epsilon subunit family exonuclease [Breznakia sp. PFB2-8]MDF9859526.1 DNA polymerase III epsilon subunit family exonuclease [Breznakia sp. PH5-24]
MKDKIIVPDAVLCNCYQERKTNIHPSDYIVFDTETTGLSPTHNRVIEIGAIKYHNYEKIEEFNQLINPEESISSFITNLTGIRNEDLIDKPTIKSVLLDFYEFIEDYTLVAHNASYDVKMLAGEAHRCQLDLFPNMVIDTVPLARKTIPKPLIENHRLETLKNYFGLVNNSHRAIDDCETCNTVYQYYCEQQSK